MDMQVPMQISFRHVEPSVVLEDVIRKNTERLEKYFPRITSVKTVVTRSALRHRKGNLYQIRIDLTLPGGNLVVGNDSDLNHAHEDPYVAVRDSFLSARRQIRDFVRTHFRKRERPKQSHRLRPALTLVEGGEV